MYEEKTMLHLLFVSVCVCLEHNICLITLLVYLLSVCVFEEGMWKVYEYALTFWNLYDVNCCVLRHKLHIKTSIKMENAAEFIAFHLYKEKAYHA